MDHDDVAHPVGVSVLFRGAAMGSPPGMSDADRTRQLFSCQGRLQILQFSDTPPDPDLLPLDKGDPCRIISPVLKPLEPVNQNGNDVLIPDISNNAAHILSPNPEIEYTFNIFLFLFSLPLPSLLRPPFHVFLIHTAYRQRTRGHILCDCRTGSDHRSIPDLYRGHKLRITPHKDP